MTVCLPSTQKSWCGANKGQCNKCAGTWKEPGKTRKLKVKKRNLEKGCCKLAGMTSCSPLKPELKWCGDSYGECVYLCYGTWQE